MLHERSSLIIRVLTGNIFFINIFGSLAISLFLWIFVQLGDPANPEIGSGMLPAEIVTIVLSVIFVLSFFLAVFWSIKKHWSGYVILVISALHIAGIGYLHILYGWQRFEFVFEIFFILPVLVDIVVITLTSIILFKKSKNLKVVEESVLLND